MKVAVIGATGRAGREITTELVRRGHKVTAIARHPDTALNHPLVDRAAGDVADPAALERLIAGHDAVVSAVHFVDSDPAVLVSAVRAARVRRYLVVGGAASLEVAPGRRLIDEPGFPNGVAIIGSDADGSHGQAGGFTMIYFDERGVSRLYQVMVGEGTVSWRRDDAKFSQTNIITAQGQDRLVSQGRMSRDGGAWEDDLSQEFQREG